MLELIAAILLIAGIPCLLLGACILFLNMGVAFPSGKGLLLSTKLMMVGAIMTGVGTLIVGILVNTSG